MIDIYKHTSKTSNKSYIGVATYGMESRWNNHIKLSKSGGYHFHKAIKKYGEEDFTHEILHQAESMTEALSIEQYYIAWYNTFESGYNQTKGGQGILGKKHSERTKQKIRNARKNQVIKHSNETKKKIGQGNKGKVISRTQRNHHSKIMSGRTKSEEFKKAVSKKLSNTLWITNGSISKRIPTKDSIWYLTDGWEQGRHHPAWNKKGNKNEF